MPRYFSSLFICRAKRSWAFLSPSAYVRLFFYASIRDGAPNGAAPHSGFCARNVVQRGWTDRIKRGFLKELTKGFNVLNMMTMPFLIFFFGKGSTFFLIDTRPLVKRTALCIEDFANFCFLDALFQVCCDGSFSHGLRIWHGCSPGKWLIV